MLRRQRSEPKPVKLQPAVIVNAYGHRVEAASAFAPPVADCRNETTDVVKTHLPEKRVTHARKSTMTARERDIKPVLKMVRDLAPGDQSRLWGHVASLPCQVQGCSRVGVQVSHGNSLEDGKARSMKAVPWRVAAICPEHHYEIDAGKSMSKQERRDVWLMAHVRTIGELFAKGLIRPV